MCHSNDPRPSTTADAAAVCSFQKVRAFARMAMMVVAGAAAAAGGALFASAVPTFQTLKTFSSAAGRPAASLVQASDGNFYGTAQWEGGAGAVFRIAPAGSGFTTSIVHAFAGTDGSSPGAPVIQGPDGALYGTTSTGGTYGLGTVFKVNLDGSGFATLRSFAGDAEGASPSAGPLVAADGYFYGTTMSGGASNFGTIFRISGDGLSFTTLHAFSGGVEDGSIPMGLILASDGSFYGTTQYGGEYSKGIVFEMSADGGTVSTIHTFDVGRPFTGLVEGSDGKLYGTTSEGVQSIFALSTGGSFDTLYTFTGEEGVGPRGSLIEADDGNLYGTTYSGPGESRGTIYRLEINVAPAVLTPIYSFTGTADGEMPATGVIQGLDGKLYGTAPQGGPWLAGTAFRVTLDGSEFQVISSFPASVNPEGSLIRGADGWLYGTASWGNEAGTAGAVFKMRADGSAYTVLHAFGGPDGSAPFGGLVHGLDGYYYGTTSAGGGASYGTIFRISADGTNFSTIHFFGSNEGNSPTSALVQAEDGTFYGTTCYGGANGYGTVFSLKTTDGGETWNFSTLHSFTSSDGAQPVAGLVLDADAGMLYGVATSADNGLGVIYQISISGDFSVLHAFASNEGGYPSGTLLLDGAGTLYGTAMQGGNGYGTVFSIPSGGGDLTVLHSFLSAAGGYPRGGVILGSDGKLYGTTADGGSGFGTVFTLTPDGNNFSFLHTFDGDHGTSPRGTLLWGGDGYVYGTTKFGGPSGEGTAFRLRVTTSSLPTVSIAADGPTTFCQTLGVGLTATPSGGTGSYAGYQWYRDAVAIDEATSSTYTATEGGNYTVTVTDSAANTSAPSEPVTVTVNPLPDATITPGGPTTFPCGGSVVLTASDGTSWLWSTAETTQSITVSESGGYRVTVTDAAGCSATSDSVQVEAQVPSAFVSGGGSICPRGSRTIEAALTGTPPWNVTWSDGFVQNGVTSSPATRTVSPRRETTYTAMWVTDANCAGTSDGSATVTPAEAPKAVLKGSATICPGGEATLSVTLTGTAPWSITWSDGEMEDGITESSHIRKVTVTEPTVYSLTAVSDASCSGTARGAARIRVSSRCP